MKNRHLVCPLAAATALALSGCGMLPGGEGTKTVNIRGDRDVNLGTLTRVMDVIRRAGVQGVGIVVEPAPR